MGGVSGSNNMAGSGGSGTDRGGASGSNLSDESADIKALSPPADSGIDGATPEDEKVGKGSEDR